jgi:hypothetical protein
MNRDNYSRAGVERERKVLKTKALEIIKKLFCVLSLHPFSSFGTLFPVKGKVA